MWRAQAVELKNPDGKTESRQSRGCSLARRLHLAKFNSSFDKSGTSSALEKHPRGRTLKTSHSVKITLRNDRHDREPMQSGDSHGFHGYCLLSRYIHPRQQKAGSGSSRIHCHARASWSYIQLGCCPLGVGIDERLLTDSADASFSRNFKLNHYPRIHSFAICSKTPPAAKCIFCALCQPPNTSSMVNRFIEGNRSLYAARTMAFRGR
jgi:hypothetical protein